jgi:tetratricopeptide (TPR) repeat protein
VVRMFGRKPDKNRSANPRRGAFETSAQGGESISRLLRGSGPPRNARGSVDLSEKISAPADGQAPVKRRVKRKKRWLLASELVLLLGFAGVLAVKLKVIDLNTVKAAVLSRATSIYPDKDGAYAFLGSHYTSCGNSAEALKACRTLVERKPDDSSAHVLLGKALHEANQLEKAIECYKEALRLAPGSFEAHLGLGETYSALRRHTEAIEFLEEAIRIKPLSAHAHLSLGVALSNSGQYDKAMESFRQAKELDPDIVEGQVLSGKAYLEAGRPDQAIERFEEAILFDQGHAQARFSLGRACLQVGDRGLALEQQKALQTLDPKLAEDLSALIGDD